MNLLFIAMRPLFSTKSLAATFFMVATPSTISRIGSVEGGNNGPLFSLNAKNPDG
jgi:hypothetical protein